MSAYVNLKERELAREGGRFIAEGEFVVRRLLESRYAVESLLLAEHRVAEMVPLAPAGVPVYFAPATIVNRIVGFKFHSGVMAVGLRGQPVTLAEAAAHWANRPLTLVVLPEISNTENMGALIRISAAFGVDAVILGKRTCDPFYRQSIRVSMGAIFSLPLVRSASLLDDLRALHDVHGVELFATVLSPDAERLSATRRCHRMGILFGNEAQGLSAEHIAACSRRITIPMLLGTDSLNVAVSAGIVLFHFTQGGGAIPQQG